MTFTDYQWDMYLRGCDDPRTIAAEMADRDYEDCDRDMDAMEARGGPAFVVAFSDELPF